MKKKKIYVFLICEKICWMIFSLLKIRVFFFLSNIKIIKKTDSNQKNNKEKIKKRKRKKKNKKREQEERRRRMKENSYIVTPILQHANESIKTITYSCKFFTIIQNRYTHIFNHLTFVIL